MYMYLTACEVEKRLSPSLPRRNTNTRLPRRVHILELLLHAIQEMERNITVLMYKYGDILVPEHEDPGYFTTAENPHQRLMYGMILSATQGLMEVLINLHNC
ncbi:hypothetical protein MMC29_004114 [Sticta canariensis]|nr:hypothetical protein [Sticta canariensis]